MYGKTATRNMYGPNKECWDFSTNEALCTGVWFFKFCKKKPQIFQGYFLKLLNLTNGSLYHRIL